MKGFEVGDKVIIRPDLTSGYYPVGRFVLYISGSKAKYRGQIHTIEKIHEKNTKNLNIPVFYLKGLEGVWVPSTVLDPNSINTLLIRRMYEGV